MSESNQSIEPYIELAILELESIDKLNSYLYNLLYQRLLARYKGRLLQWHFIKMIYLNWLIKSLYFYTLIIY